MITFLSLRNEDDRAALYEAAYAAKTRHIGRKTYYRGLVEVSNNCVKNCCYGGIRRDNGNVTRFQMTSEDIAGLVRWA